MTSDEASLLAAIDAAPLDEGLRGVYADFLDEQDRPEEATRQRKFVAAYHTICEFTRDYTEGWEYDADGEQIPGSLKYDFGKVMREVAHWRESIEKNGQTYRTRWGFDMTHELCFSTDHAQDALNDPDTRRRFWEAFEVLTGYRPPDDIRHQEWYRCAC